jgi:hypothetical protein
MLRKKWLYTIIGFTFGNLLVGAMPLAAQDDCTLVMDAMTKIFDTASHVYVTMNLTGKSETGESIYTGGVIYTKYNGKWTAGSTTKELKEMTQKNRQNNKVTCRHLKDELVNGEMAAVYSVHEVSPRSTTDSTNWISKANGLPLRQDIDIEGGKSHMSTRYEYGNVKAPL